MAQVTPKGFYVWNLTTDPFSHTQLAANWTLLDALLDAAPQEVDTSATLPGSPFAGQIVMLTAATGGFAAWTLVRYDGSAWKAVGPFEVLPALPTLNNTPGRIIILSAASGGFDAWSVVAWNGTTWGVIGGFQQVNTGGLQGLQLDGDIFFNNPNRGPVLIDRSTAEKWRLYINNGKLLHEKVT